ncbi:MAG: class I SAM-dependent methyltransferase [Burkholderiales bacterium]
MTQPSVAATAAPLHGRFACAACASARLIEVADLGVQPLANSYIAAERYYDAESCLPLVTYWCEDCHLMQAPSIARPEQLFGDYLYFSSYSDSWLAHCKDYVAMAAERFSLGKEHHVVELASNDGYLLQYFVARGVPVTGIEPAANVAKVAVARGVPTLCDFFGERLAGELARGGRAADLVVANNVLAHVPDINDFVAGVRLLLKPGGVATFEFPSLLNLLAELQFDTIYHEHFSYLSLSFVAAFFARHGLRAFDVESIPTHGGSLRVYACNAGSRRPTAEAVRLQMEKESRFGLERAATYEVFREETKRLKRAVLQFLIGLKEQGRRVAAYGAAAKGNTLLNYCGIRRDLIDFVVDRNVHKQGHFLPGSRLPILPPEAVAERRPDYLVVLPWNLAAEIKQQMAEIRRWGGKFVTFVPRVAVD